MFSRRSALLGAGAGLLIRSVEARAAGKSVSERLAAIERASAALGRGELDGLDWRSRIGDALAELDALELRAALQLDWTTIAQTTRAQGRAEQKLESSELLGTPAQPHFRRRLFSLRRDHAIVPHAHRHIVSVFVVLDGRARARHYDRLREQPDAIVIRPSDERVLSIGEFAAICDQADNVHWLRALDDCLLLNFSATVPGRFRRDQHPAGRVYLDPDGEPLEDGSIRAPRCEVGLLQRKYEGTGL